MRFHSALPLIAVGLVLSTTAFAQNQPDGVAPPLPPLPGGQAPGLLGVQKPTTQSSSIRAFNAGPDGLIRSLYLRNGSVVDVSSDLGRQLSTHVRRGARIGVTGTRTTVHGQRIITANQITMGSQTYIAHLQPMPGGHVRDDGRGVAPPPLPPQHARLSAPEGLGGPRPERGPVPPPPPAGRDSHPLPRPQDAPAPPPNQGAPMGPQGGPRSRNLPAPPPAPDAKQPNANTPPAPPPQGGPAATPGQQDPNTPPPANGNSANPVPAPSL